MNNYKLTRRERIDYFKNSLNPLIKSFNNIKYSQFSDSPIHKDDFLNRNPNAIVYKSNLKKPPYTRFQLYIDLIIAILKTILKLK